MQYHRFISRYLEPENKMKTTEREARFVAASQPATHRAAMSSRGARLTCPGVALARRCGARDGSPVAEREDCLARVEVSGRWRGPARATLDPVKKIETLPAATGFAVKMFSLR